MSNVQEHRYVNCLGNKKYFGAVGERVNRQRVGRDEAGKKGPH